MSSPREAMSAISSAVGVFLDVFGIGLLLLFGSLPGCDKVIVFALGVMADLKNHGTEATAAPTDCAKLPRIVALLIDEVYLIEYVPYLFQADAVFPFDVPALLSIEFKPHRTV